MVKWITENLGTAAYLDVIETKGINIVDVRNLLDKSGNAKESVIKKIEEALLYLNSGNKVVICCDYGMSRSNSIAAGVLSKYKNIPFNDAVRQVMQATQESAIKIEVLTTVREALQDENPNKISNNKKRILITGGSGFIGKSLIPKLKTTNTLFAPTSKELDLLNNPVEIDLFVKENNITHILHLAYPRIFTTYKSFGDALVIFKNILDTCVGNKIKLTYPSSWVVYSGYKSESLFASENLPLFPKGLYGETKFLCEVLLKQYEQMYGLKYALLRFSPVYGNFSDKPKFIYNFIDKALKNMNIQAHKYINGFPVLDLLYIDDLIEIITKIIDQDYIGELNIGSGKGVSTTEVAQIIIELLGSQSEIEHNKLQEYSSNIIMDISKTEEIFEWHPKNSIRDGIKKILNENLNYKELI